MNTVRSLPDILHIEEINSMIKYGTILNNMKYAVGHDKLNAFIQLSDHADTETFDNAINFARKKPTFFRQVIKTINPLIKDGLLLTKISTINDKQIYNDLLSNLRSKNINLINLNTEDDISKLSDIYVSQAKDSYVYPVGYVYDTLIMIKYGFFPTSIDTNKNYFIDYATDMPIDSIEFWHTKHVIDKLLSLSQELKWSYKTLETHKRNGVTSAISLPLILYAPELVYKASKRPVNDMSLFRGPLVNKVKRSDIINNSIMINGDEWKLIPVTRYAEGMSKGLFFTNTDTEYCGTFYYYEPESTTLLAYKTSESFFNKYTAVKTLGKNKILDPETVKLLNDLSNNLAFKLFTYGELPRDLMLTPSEYIQLNSQINNVNISNKIPKDTSKYYVGPLIELYALEDGFDQPLCILGKSDNLNIIVLESMVGSHQVVTEILDTRDREDSFKSLIYIVD